MNKKLIITMVLIFLILSFEVYYRKASGGWNVFIPPKKIHCFKREYHVSKKPVQKVAGIKKPLYKVEVDNPFWNGMVFSQLPKGPFVPTVLYLKISPNLYRSYELSGGP